MPLIRKVITMLMIICVCTGISACNRNDTQPPESSDMLYKDTKYDEVKYIFVMGEEVYMIDPAYRIEIYTEELKDGHFYELTADITYLNGGVAGYVDYPQIEKVIGCKEVSPFEIGLPDISEKRYGIMLIGDYADGDIFLHEYMKMALWKDGAWIYQYDREMDGADGTLICYRNDVSTEDIEKGISEGVLSCEEYFVQPAINN